MQGTCDVHIFNFFFFSLDGRIKETVVCSFLKLSFILQNYFLLTQDNITKNFQLCCLNNVTFFFLVFQNIVSFCPFFAFEVERNFIIFFILFPVVILITRTYLRMKISQQCLNFDLKNKLNLVPVNQCDPSTNFQFRDIRSSTFQNIPFEI